MCAARNNRADVVDFLVDTLENIKLEAIDYEGQTSLHHAAQAGHYQIVQKLLKLGANPNATNNVSVIYKFFINK